MCKTEFRCPSEGKNESPPTCWNYFFPYFTYLYFTTTGPVVHVFTFRDEKKADNFENYRLACNCLCRPCYNLLVPGKKTDVRNGKKKRSSSQSTKPICEASHDSHQSAPSPPPTLSPTRRGEARRQFPARSEGPLSSLLFGNACFETPFTSACRLVWF